MDRTKIIENLIVTLVLILLLLKLGVGIYEQVDYVRAFYSVKYLIEHPMIILRSNLFFDPIVCVLAIAGLFIRKPIGFVLMLILPSLMLFYRTIPLLSITFWVLALPVILFVLINLSVMQKRYHIASTTKQVKLNGIALAIGFSIALIMFYFKGNLMWMIENVLN
ncbi:hypothetical protein DF185_10895 [Marinifilum breve]|uniref:Uncharacterized protein n=1 Tax=Marinifilum breve TaxID=2184082 RepID=A0A2V4A1F8_9BACT|nr:hypothetical protein [Marinifilum breve]PXY01150.1 hypothetical protein DF185_10895 [Marinifilum breve]